MLGNARRHQLFSRAQLLHLTMQRDMQWGGIQAIIAKNSIVGRGAHSIVFQGYMRPYPVPVAIKVLDVRLAQAHSTRDFQASLAGSFLQFCISATFARTGASPLARPFPSRSPFLRFLQTEVDIMLRLDHPVRSALLARRLLLCKTRGSSAACPLVISLFSGPLAGRLFLFLL